MYLPASDKHLKILLILGMANLWPGQSSSESTQMPFIFSQKKYLLEARTTRLALLRDINIKANPPWGASRSWGWRNDVRSSALRTFYAWAVSSAHSAAHTSPAQGRPLWKLSCLSLLYRWTIHCPLDPSEPAVHTSWGQMHDTASGLSGVRSCELKTVLF